VEASCPKEADAAVQWFVDLMPLDAALRLASAAVRAVRQQASPGDGAAVFDSDELVRDAHHVCWSCPQR
jgi:hypothetical protein